MANGEVIKTLSTDVTYYSVNTLSQDGKTLAFVSQLPEHECLVKIIDMEQGKSVAEIPFPTIVKSLKISPDGKNPRGRMFQSLRSGLGSGENPSKIAAP